MNEDGQAISNSSDNNKFSKKFAENTNSTESSTNTIEDRNKFYALFVMAQIGGLYSFLKLVFGVFMSLISDKMTIMTLINSMRKNKNYFRVSTSKSKKRSKRILPTQNTQVVIIY